jgi:peptidoglycan/xylan/chitin deacetylase (PgdA/CDA1 family)
MLVNFKPAIWKALATSYYYSGLARFLHRGKVAILTYHRIVTEDMVRKQHIQSGMYVLAESFDKQIAYLKSRFVILTFEELLQMWRDSSLDSHTSYCVITFDDGWEDNYRLAFPILRKYGLPATIFLATDYVGTLRWFWSDQVAFLLGSIRNRMTAIQIGNALATVFEEVAKTGKSSGWVHASIGSGDQIDVDGLVEQCKRVNQELLHQFVNKLSRKLSIDLPTEPVLLNWDQVREMADQGITFGSHSCSHRIMTQITQEEAEKELVESRQAMLGQGIKPVPVFCYPNGGLNQSVKTLVKENGYLAALGCRIGLEGRQPEDPFALRRFSLHEDGTASRSLFSFALSGLR